MKDQPCQPTVGKNQESDRLGKGKLHEETDSDDTHEIFDWKENQFTTRSVKLGKKKRNGGAKSMASPKEGQRLFVYFTRITIRRKEKTKQTTDSQKFHVDTLGSL